MHYSPLRYPGGKNCIFKFVSSLFYENNLVGCNYAEPYAGGAGLALRLLFEGYANQIYLNDLDRSIYSFWLTILNHPDEFCEWIDTVDITIDNWKKFKEIQSNKGTTNIYELAQSTFFLNRTNISGVIKGGVIGGTNQTGKYKIDARFNRTELITKIQKIKENKERIILSNLDGVEFIKKVNNKKEDIFIYLDPPYFLKGAELYMNYFAKNDHIRLSQYVKKLNKPWMVSYDNQDFIIQLYKNNSRISYELAQAASNRVGDEILIFSDEIYYTSSVLQLKQMSI